MLYPTGKSDPGAQTYRFISCCEKRRSDTACVRSCPLSSIECGNYRKYVEGNHIIIQSSGEASDNNNIKYEIHGIIGTRTSRTSVYRSHLHWRKRGSRVVKTRETLAAGVDFAVSATKLAEQTTPLLVS